MVRRLDYINLLPEEMITNIFTRLPAESLGRCKCVSKPWNSFISDTDFVQAHLTKTSVTKLVLISVLTDQGALYSVDFFGDKKYSYKNPNCKNYLRIYSSRMEEKPSTIRKLNFNLPNKWYRVWGSCDGLILVQDNRALRSMFVLNPTTLESKELPVMPMCFYNYDDICTVFGFGYDLSCDDYAVVAISYHREFNIDACVYVYMLKTKQWKKVGFSPYDHKHQRCVSGIYFKGSLHWLIEKPSIIAAYDVGNKNFSGVPLPIGDFDSSSEFPRLGILKGCLCLFSNVINSISELYVMQEYGVVESWTKLSVLLTDVSHVASLDLLEDSSVLLKSGQSVLLVSSAEKSTIRNMKVLGLPNDFRVGMSFVESLVSPNKDGNKKIRRRKSETMTTRNRDDISGWLMAW
ncbi:F-box domain-containing protein [Heracleum sosnowskyi]|uniref:F-box domain-containing protein n=1 Tax=Heracleum sosnowskyi TaxID=360622 RepID=A0AAD8HQH0_9APIA|nr:F-box domain-containing protein [Heracleum sosnowskyi]